MRSPNDNRAPGLVHHSDRGVQYASGDYVGILKKHQIIPSMSRPANPYDNASCESFFKTLKREEIYANPYTDLDHLRANIEEFIERYYNRCRLHSALGVSFTGGIRAGGSRPRHLSLGATMSFWRHGKIYRSDVTRSRPKPAPRDHRVDESSVGYSLAGWSPPEPASASPTGKILKKMRRFEQ